MTFKSVLDIDCGIRFIYDNLELNSSCARKMLLETPMMRSKREIDVYYGKLNQLFNKNLAPISNKLMCLKDIETTIKRVAGGIVLDDIELFEIKYLAMISRDVLLLMRDQNITAVNLPDLGDVVAILDPDKLNIPSFYVYDSYSPELREIRRQMRALQGNGDDMTDEQRGELAVLLQRNAEIELKVRMELSQRLRGRAADLKLALSNLSFLDILIAKAQQMRMMGLCFPNINEGGDTAYCGMFNPAVKEVVAKQGREYMPVDISIEREPVTIIGANMGGKSVVLKSLALNQLLAQFGFGVAAREWQVNLVGEVALCIGDEQSIVRGVSSFAGEILAIDAVIKKIRGGKSLLALIDEPARTTNPVEGTALVEGLLEVIGKVKGGFVLTTHYNIDNDKVKRYRVKGLRDGVMDYTLEQTQCGDVPQEAIAIAQSLGIDPEWIECTKRNINN